MKVLGTIHETDLAVNTDLFSSPFSNTANAQNSNLSLVKKIIVQVKCETANSNLRAKITDGSTMSTVVLGKMVVPLQVYTFEFYLHVGSSVDLQYNGIAGPQFITMTVLESNDLSTHIGTLNAA
jgi:hypothetical protein